jgi:hypothetical protein
MYLIVCPGQSLQGLGLLCCARKTALRQEIAVEQMEKRIATWEG